MNTPKWKGLVRHILTLVGTILVAMGKIDETVVTPIIDTVMQIAGAVMVLLSLIQSVRAPEKQITETQYRAMKSM